MVSLDVGINYTYGKNVYLPAIPEDNTLYFTIPHSNIIQIMVFFGFLIFILYMMFRDNEKLRSVWNKIAKRKQP